MPRLVIVLYFIIILFSPVVIAGDSLSLSQRPLINQKNQINRIPDDHYFEKYLEDKEYNYGLNFIEPESNRLFSRLWEYLISILRQSLKAIKLLPVIFKIIFYIACIFLLYIIVTQTKFYKLFYTEKEVKIPEFSEVDHLDENFDFEAAINMQISRQNFRSAVRLLHLRLLKELEVNNLIRYSREKTNREYAREIADNNLRRSFYLLTSVYNQVWYGNYELSKQEFEKFAGDFNQFSKGINVEEK